MDKLTRECLAILVAKKLSSEDVLERRCARAALVTCSSARVCKITSVATRARVHGQVRPGVARASWCEDFVYRAGFAVGERLRRELLLYCCETNYSNGKRLTRFSRPTVLFVRWRQHTNTIRPHSALGYRPPAPPGVAAPGRIRRCDSVGEASPLRFSPPWPRLAD